MNVLGEFISIDFDCFLSFVRHFPEDYCSEVDHRSGNSRNVSRCFGKSVDSNSSLRSGIRIAAEESRIIVFVILDILTFAVTKVHNYGFSIGFYCNIPEAVVAIGFWVHYVSPKSKSVFGLSTTCDEESEFVAQFVLYDKTRMLIEQDFSQGVNGFVVRSNSSSVRRILSVDGMDIVLRDILVEVSHDFGHTIFVNSYNDLVGVFELVDVCHELIGILCKDGTFSRC